MRLGPIVDATLVVANLERALAAYVGGLGLLAGAIGRVPRQRALDMGDAALADAACVQLRSVVDRDSWLTLIEMAEAIPSTSYGRRGWGGLSLAVRDVDELAAQVDRSAWRVLSEPTDGTLVIAGADGEVLSLVQKSPWPLPCRIPVARCAVDRVFAASLAVRDRGDALGFYEGLGLVDRWRIDAAVSQVDANERTAAGPLAIAQLRADNLLEIRQLPWLPATDATLRTGIRMLGFARSDAGGRRLLAADDPSARILAGPEGEAIELV